MQERHFVEHVGEPLALLLPVQVHAPEGVVQRFGAHCHLCGERLFREVLHGSAHLEVLREVVRPVHSEHRLARLSEVGVALVGSINLCACVKDALVQDGHLSGRIVDAIVSPFGEFNATCRYMHRPLRHVVGAQRDDVGRCSTELSHQHKLVFLCYLLGNGLRRVVELGEGIFRSHIARHALLHHIVEQILAERLGFGEEHAAV